MSREIVNAKITSTELGFEDHGILTAMIRLEYASGGQGFGGYALHERAMADFVGGVLKAVGAEKWEDLKGMYVRVDSERTKVHQIGHILKDTWFCPEVCFSKYE